MREAWPCQGKPQAEEPDRLMKAARVAEAAMTASLIGGPVPDTPRRRWTAHWALRIGDYLAEKP